MKKCCIKSVIDNLTLTFRHDLKCYLNVSRGSSPVSLFPDCQSHIYELVIIILILLNVLATYVNYNSICLNIFED